MDRTSGPRYHEFFLRCRWPTDTHGPGYSPIGISWLEIAVGIMFILGMHIPVIRTLADGQSHLVHPATFQDIQMMCVTLSEMAKTVSHLTAQVSKLLRAPLLPDIPRASVKSMYILGETQYCQGFKVRPFKVRPSFDFQEEVMVTLELYVESGRKFPNFGFSQRLDIDDSLWLPRGRSARNAMAEVKSSAKTR